MPKTWADIDPNGCKEKRTTVPLYPPAYYEVQPRLCPTCNELLDFSEYKHLLYCKKCDKDIVPFHDGLLDGGPVPLFASSVMGIRYDYIDLTTDKVVFCDGICVPWSLEWRKIKKKSHDAISGIERNFMLVDQYTKIILENKKVDYTQGGALNRKNFIIKVLNGNL